MHRSFVSGTRRVVIYLLSPAGAGQSCFPRLEHAGRGRRAPATRQTLRRPRSAHPPPRLRTGASSSHQCPKPRGGCPARSSPAGCRAPSPCRASPPAPFPASRLPAVFLALPAGPWGRPGRERRQWEQRRPARRGCWGERAGNAERSLPRPACCGLEAEKHGLDSA